MRPIKFRAWWPEAKKMFLPTVGCDLLIRIDGKPFVQIDVTENSGLDQVVDMIFMEFTGLPDKNGREIWEADILKTCDMRGELRIVIFEAGAFWQKNKDGIKTLIGNIHPSWHEVIGNIYENPELLK